MLPFGGTVADFPLTTDAQGVFESVMCLAFVQPNLRPTLHVGVEQPLNDEERAFDAPNFTKGEGQLVLPWV